LAEGVEDNLETLTSSRLAVIPAKAGIHKNGLDFMGASVNPLYPPLLGDF
jgi:hypothetical protein